jgi:two-component system, NarL family, sensor histidine kinase DesK
MRIAATPAAPDGPRRVRHDLQMKLLDVEAGSDFRTPRPSRARLGVLLGLLFLAGPLSDLFDESLGAAHKAALLIGLAVFVAIYVSLLPPAAWLSRLGPEASLVALALLPLIAIVLLVAGAPTSFAALFVYFVAAAGLRLPARAAVVVTFLTALGVGIAGWLHRDGGGAIAATVLTIVSIGILMTAFGRIARANRELRATREELARVAVSEERLRIARDLHDLLGHSHSVIAVKSELARKLVDVRGELEAGALPGGGFLLRLTVPLEGT